MQSKPISRPVVKKQTSKSLQNSKRTPEETHRILSIYKSNYTRLNLHQEDEHPKAKKQSRVTMRLHKDSHKKFRKNLLKSVNTKKHKKTRVIPENKVRSPSPGKEKPVQRKRQARNKSRNRSFDPKPKSRQGKNDLLRSTGKFSKISGKTTFSKNKQIQSPKKKVPTKSVDNKRRKNLKNYQRPGSVGFRKRLLRKANQDKDPSTQKSKYMSISILITLEPLPKRKHNPKIQKNIHPKIPRNPQTSSTKKSKKNSPKVTTKTQNKNPPLSRSGSISSANSRKSSSSLTFRDTKILKQKLKQRALITQNNCKINLNDFIINDNIFSDILGIITFL